MSRIRARGGHPPGTDDGFTLIEVMVAVVILMVVMSSVSVFMVSSIRTSATLQRRDAATQLADEAMELVRAVPPVDISGGVSALVRGRTRSAVDTQWLTSPSGLSTTAKLWDATATASSIPVIPLRVTKTVGQQAYVIDTFIGSCRQAATDTTCSSAFLVGAEFFRVVVRVSWNPGAGASCGGQTCEYVLATVVNGNGEPQFNTSVDAVRPIATADVYTVVAGAPLSVSLLGNDIGVFSGTPVAVLGTGPANGVLSGPQSTGAFTYTSNASFSGIDTFTYRVTDTSGLTSDPATVTITVTPGTTVADTAAVTYPGPIVVNVLANDTGSYRTGTITAVTTPSSGSAAISGNQIVYTPTLGFQGTATMTYTNVAGANIGTAQLSVTVSPPAAPTASSPTVCVRRSLRVTVSFNLSAYVTATTTGGTYARTSDPNPAVWNTPTGPAAGDVNATVSVRAIATPAVALYPMGYRFTDAWGRSATGTVTLQVKTSCP